MTDSTNAPAFAIDEPTFEAVFKSYYAPLHAYANAILKDSEGAEEVVQTVFLRLWEKRLALRINVSIKSYLYKAVYYDALNYIKHQKVTQRHWDQTHYALTQQPASLSSQVLEGEENELVGRIQQTLEALPEKCRMVFHLSRFEELRYAEIAERMGISLKTVEAHMSKALKTLRQELAEFLPVLLLIFQLLFKPWNQ